MEMVPPLFSFHKISEAYIKTVEIQVKTLTGELLSACTLNVSVLDDISICFVHY